MQKVFAEALCVLANTIKMFRLRNVTSGRKFVQPPLHNSRTDCFWPFSCACPFLWNSLTREIRFSSSLSSFKNEVKS